MEVISSQTSFTVSWKVSIYYVNFMAESFFIGAIIHVYSFIHVRSAFNPMNLNM